MNEYIKNSYKKLFTALLMILSCCVIKSEHYETEPKRNLTVIYNEIAALGTPDDVSGLYNILTQLLTNDATIIAKLCTLLANDAIIMHKLCEILSNDAEIMHKLCELLSNDNMILHKLCEILSNDNTILHKLCEILSNDNVILHKLCEALSNDAAMMHKLCEILSNDAAMMHKLCAILANTTTIITDLNVISSNIVNLGNPCDVSNLYNLLTLIIFNLQLDPIVQVLDAISNPSLQNLVTSADLNIIAVAGLAAYQANIAAALAASVTATTPATQTHANTQLALNAINIAIGSFNTLAIQWSIDGYYTPTSPYSVAQITNALAQLKSTLMYLLAQQPV